MLDINLKLINAIKESLKRVFSLEGQEGLIMIETPKEKIHGDYSSNIALRLSKVLKKNPQIIANELKTDLLNNDFIENIEIAGPGFINFFVKKDEISKVIGEILTKVDSYGSSNFGNNEKVMVEYVSANPTGDLHLGHARGAAFGDSLTRILKFSGFDVLREYYVNDAGNQIEVLGNSLFERYKEALGETFDIEKIGYQGEDVKILANKIANEIGRKYLDDSLMEERKEYFKDVGIKLELDKIKKDLELFRISFDHYQSERELYRTGKVANTLKLLKESDYTYELDGALWLKTTLFNDDKDRVLIKNDGSYTYLLPDIAYHKDKFDRGYSNLINLFGADHHGYMARLRAGLNILGYNPNDLNFLIIQIVRLMENGLEIKMSKRTGNAITIRELCNDVGVDVARYFFISKPLESHFDFDLDLAKKHSNENPTYYIQYAYARISSILSKRNDFEVKNSYSLLVSDKEIDLIKALNEFPNVVNDIAKTKEVHKMCNYVYKVASLFHSFYNDYTVIDEENIELTKERLALAKACQIVIKNALNLLGIEPKEKM